MIVRARSAIVRPHLPMSRPIIDLPAFRRLLLLLPYAIAVFVYAPSFANGFLWDDRALIEKNALVHDLSHIWTLITHDFWYVADTSAADMEFAGRYYRPVVTLAFAAQATLFGLNPAGFHFVSLVLHLACCALVYRALRLRLRGEPSTRAIAASLGTMLFAIHPTRPEVVGWISGSTDLWMTFWSLVALNIWTSHRHRALGLVAVVIAATLALLSKETAIVLPFALAVDAWLLAKDPLDVKGELRRAASVIIPVVAVLGLRMWLMPIPSTGMLDRGLIVLIRRVLASVGEYVLAIFWHVPGTVQMAEARFGPEGQIFAATSLLLGSITVIAIIVTTLIALRKRSLRPWLADVAWFTAFLAPVANIVPLGMKVLVAARFLYAPLVGVVALFSRGIAEISVANRRTILAGAAGVTIALSAFFGFSSIRQLDSFYSDETLWEYEYKVNRQNSYVLGQLLDIHGQRNNEGRVIELLQELQKLSSSGAWPAMQQLEFFRQTVKSLGNLARTSDRADLETLARAYDDLFDRGDVGFAVRGLSISLKISPKVVELMKQRSPSFRLEHALLHVRAGNLDRASELLKQAVDAIPHYGRAWLFLARVDALRGEWGEVEAALERATSTGVPPNEIERIQSDIQQARGHLAEAGDALVQRALAYRALRAPELIRPAAEEGLRHHPGEPNLIAMLVELELSENRPEAATRWVRSGREAAPQLDGLWGHLQERVARANERLGATD